jgi:hypothetical protein
MISHGWVGHNCCRIRIDKNNLNSFLGWNELIVIPRNQIHIATNNDRAWTYKTDFIEVSLGIVLKLVCCVVGFFKGQSYWT